jgi:hypothetical protein
MKRKATRAFVQVLIYRGSRRSQADPKQGIAMTVAHGLAIAAGPNIEGWLQVGELALGFLLSAVVGLEREIRRACARFFGALDAVQAAAEKESRDPGAVYAAYTARIADLTESLHRDRKRPRTQATTPVRTSARRSPVSGAWPPRPRTGTGPAPQTCTARSRSRLRRWPRPAPPYRHGPDFPLRLRLTGTCLT